MLKEIDTLKPVERHMSIDSAKDSGIGCSSSFSEDEKLSDRKINMIEYLLPNSYFRHSSRCYVFPGAEIFYNSDDEGCDNEDNDIDDSGHFTQFDDEDSTFGTTLPVDSTTLSNTTKLESVIEGNLQPQIAESKWGKCSFSLGKEC